MIVENMDTGTVDGETYFLSAEESECVDSTERELSDNALREVQTRAEWRDCTLIFDRYTNAEIE